MSKLRSCSFLKWKGWFHRIKGTGQECSILCIGYVIHCLDISIPPTISYSVCRIDLVSFELASTVQKAGEVVYVALQRVACDHSTEHALYCFFDYYSKLIELGVLASFYSNIGSTLESVWQVPETVIKMCINARSNGVTLRTQGVRLQNYFH